jgi:hypothetical protein
MSLDAVILACRSDRDSAAQLTDGLGAAGLRVQLVIAGDNEIPHAPCRVLAMTRSPECKAWLAAVALDEAAAGRTIAVRLERGVEPPVLLPTYDYLIRGFLSRLIDKACLSDIVAAIRAIQQNTFPPSATARWRMVLERIWVYLVGLGAIIGLIGYFLPWNEISHMFDLEEQAAWEGLVSGKPDCDALGAYLKAHPDGRHAAQVRDALANPETETRFVPDVTTLPIAGPLLAGEGYATREAAAAAAREWALGDAQRQCANLSQRLEGRTWGTRLGAIVEQCQQSAGRWLCAVEASHACSVEVPVETAVCRISGGDQARP